MADIQQVRQEVNSACARYKQDIQKMEEYQAMMADFMSRTTAAQNEMEQAQREMYAVENEISSLQSEISRSIGDENSDNTYALNRLELLQQKRQLLAMKVSQAQSEYQQNISQYNQANNQYQNYENDANTVKNYLGQVRTQMALAAEVFQNKILGFEKSVGILGSASGNMFANSALNQAGRLGEIQRQYEENLKIAQDVIAQIDSTIEDQGSAYQRVLRR